MQRQRQQGRPVLQEVGFGAAMAAAAVEEGTVGRRGRRGDGGGGLRGYAKEEQRLMAAGAAAGCSLRSRGGEAATTGWRRRQWQGRQMRKTIAWGRRLAAVAVGRRGRRGDSG
ncbi:hypothetical protein BHM03_00016859 [Ensete ventricosum]|nr:hypothetical protein BHM03_00016859 [Ensete ventricosum]